MKVRLLSSVASGTLLILSWAVPAQAQQPQADTAVSDAGAGEAIIVTARRRAESLQDTPVAISAFSAETL